jgi:signal transduction histidine kinase
MTLRRRRTVWLIVTLALFGCFVGLAVAIANSQSKSRRDLQTRQSERAATAAALMDSLFSQSFTLTPTDTAPIIAQRVTSAEVRKVAGVGTPDSTSFVLDARGRLLASWPVMPSRRHRPTLSGRPEIRAGLAGQPAISDIIPATATQPASAETVWPYDTQYGRRLFVQRYALAPTGPYLTQYLAKIPNVSGGHAYLVDRAFRVVAAAASQASYGEALPIPGLRMALAHQTSAAYGDRNAGYYAASGQLASAPYRVVVVASDSSLYKSLGGINHYVPWLLFAGFGIAAIFSLTLMMRLMTRSELLTRTNRDLEVRSREAEEANRAKSSFLANMSHELRTPLNGIIGFSELMHDGKLGPISDQHREALGDILTSSRHLLCLINDVLDISKVESGRLTFHPEPIDPGRVAAEAIDTLRSAALERSVSVELVTEPQLPTALLDPAKLKQVMLNYLSNAIKFSPPGSLIELRLQAVEGRLHLEVEDSGPGIALADQERLFREFEQLDTSASRRSGGTGLGLAVTKRLVEAQGGEVGVRSAPGEGSCFYARLPLIHTPQLSAPTAPSELADAVAGNGRLVGVVGE